MDKNKINNNGYEYVDLELPSGTLWATMNVGASSPEESGLYFQWGDTVGYTKEQIGIGDGKKKFEKDWSDYKLSINGSDSNFSKYATNGDALELEDDAAHSHMGGDWHMPTSKQIWELIENTTTTLTKIYGVVGISFTSKRNITKSIFFPVAGFARNGLLFDNRSEGYIWSSVLSTNNICDGQYLNITSEGAHLYGDYRSFGFPVRGVIDNNYNVSNLNELIRNEIKNNFKVKVTKDDGGNVEVKLLYNGEVISSDMC